MKEKRFTDLYVLRVYNYLWTAVLIGIMAWGGNPLIVICSLQVMIVCIWMNNESWQIRRRTNVMIRENNEMVRQIEAGEWTF